MSDHFFCVHGHFYQPPRGNPFRDDELGVEEGAEPFANFNEKATALCYAPNAMLGSFELMSFNVGNALMRWMEKNAPSTYLQITAADHNHALRWGVGNALAQPAHHAILPLCRLRDQHLLVRWGMITFEHRFGRPAEGMWLPDLGVTLETLQVLRDNGVKFTILGQAQVNGANEGAGPYWVKLPSGDQITVYVRDDSLSNTVAFGVRTLGGAGRWARNTLQPLKRNLSRMLLLALEGETFGYHHPGEENFVRWLLTYEAAAVGYQVTTLMRDLQDHPPQSEVTVNEYTAWNSTRELARWRGALRQAFDAFAERLDHLCADYARPIGVDIDRALKDYIRLRLGQVTEAQFLKDMGWAKLSAQQAGALLALLRAQFHRQRIYNSNAFFYEDLDRKETRLAIADAVCAIHFAQHATGSDLTPDFCRDLEHVVSNQSGRTAAQILEEVQAWGRESGVG